MGGGVAFLDFDNDGDVDLLVITEWARELLLFRNNGNGTFTETAESAPRDRRYLFLHRGRNLFPPPQ